MDDRELARLARGGDLDAYEMLLRRYQADAQRVAFFTLRQREEAEDAVQEAFVRAWDRLDRFDVERPFRPWLLKIVTNEARDRSRARSRRDRLRLRATWNTPVSEHGRSPEQQVVTSERMQATLDEINSMDETDQIILTYRFVLDLPTAEIAELLAMPHGTVRSRISRARAQLRERLEEPPSDMDPRKWTSHG
jgi:RNA polymerase sigma-70 factor (ECF subfamily)